MSKNEKPTHPDDTPFGKLHNARQASRNARVIEVAYWADDKGDPTILYAYPLTMGDVIALDGQYPTQAETNVMQIIRQCLDAKGDPYFTLRDKVHLMNEPADVIGAILVELNGEASSFNEELKKNNG